MNKNAFHCHTDNGGYTVTLTTEKESVPTLTFEFSYCEYTGPKVEVEIPNLAFAEALEMLLVEAREHFKMLELNEINEFETDKPVFFTPAEKQ